MAFKRLLFMIVLLALALPATLNAQDVETSSIASKSGRISASYPAGWVASNEIQTDVQRILASEAVTIAIDEASLQGAALGPDFAGSHLIIATFPTLEVFPLNPNPQDFDEVVNFLYGTGNEAVTRRQIGGLPAATLAVSQSVSFTVIGRGTNIITISAEAETPADAAIIDDILQSIQIAPAAEDLAPIALTQPIRTDDTRLTLNAGSDWYTGSRGGTLYTSPAASAIQDFGFSLMSLGSLERPFFAVLSRSYGDFFRPDTTPEADDLQVVLRRTLLDFGIEFGNAYTPSEVSGFPAVGTEIAVGVNSGFAFAIDGVHTIYIFVALYDSAQEAELTPLVDAVFESISIAPLPPEIAALPPEGLNPGFRAPNFATTLLDGTEISLSDLQGQVVMLNFWFTTCPPCQEEMPAMQAVLDDYSEQGFTILGVNNREAPQNITAFMDSIGVDFPIGLDITGSIQQQYGIWNYPTSIFLDANGVVYDARLAPLTEAEIAEIVETGLGR